MSGHFDTLDEAIDLENAGVERAHAQAIVRTMRNSRVGLATRDDIERLRHDFLLNSRWNFSILLACGLTILGIVAGIATTYF